MQELPENVDPRKLKKPKGWSYPLKTSEIVEGLGLAGIDQKFGIFFDNKPPHPHKWRKKDRPDSSFTVLSISHHGPKSRLPDAPYFHMSVGLCKPQYRQKVLKLLKEEVFPLIKAWIARVSENPTFDSVSLRYREWRSPLGEPTFRLTENKTEIFVKDFDLDKKDEAEQGDVLEA
jgi:hypothetical protein